LIPYECGRIVAKREGYFKAFWHLSFYKRSIQTIDCDLVALAPRSGTVRLARACVHREITILWKQIRNNGELSINACFE